MSREKETGAVLKRLQAKAAAKKAQSAEVPQASAHSIEASDAVAGALSIDNTGKKLQSFLAKNIDYLKKHTENFELVTDFILEAIASRYSQNHNIDQSWKDLKILLSFNPPHERHLPNSDTMKLNDLYKWAITKQHLTKEENIAHSELVKYCRAYVGKTLLLKNADYCNQDGSLKEGIDLAVITQEFANNIYVIGLLKTPEMIPASWPKGGEAKFLADVTPEEARAFGVQTVEEVHKEACKASTMSALKKSGVTATLDDNGNIVGVKFEVGGASIISEESLPGVLGVLEHIFATE